MNKSTKRDCANRIRAALQMVEGGLTPHPNASAIRWVLSEVAMMIDHDTDIAPVRGWVKRDDTWIAPTADT